MVDEQSQGFESVLDDFFAWCASSGCPWRPAGGASATALLALIAQSRSQALPAGAGPHGGTRRRSTTPCSRRSTPAPTGPISAGALAQAAAGNGAGVLSMADSYVTQGSTNAADAETSIDCLDHPVARGSSSIPALAAEAAVQRPVLRPPPGLGRGHVRGVAGPGHPDPRRPPPRWGRRPSWWWGPRRTPPRPTCGRSASPPSSSTGELVTWQGENHVAYYYSGCVRAIDEAYFVAGTLPAPGTVCSD